MTTEQLAIVVPASVAVLALAISALLQVKINRQTLDAQRRLAVQERVRTTYEDMLHMVGWSMAIVYSREMHAKRKELPGPDAKHVRTVEARIGVHGSREVKAILERWAQEHRQFKAAFNDFHLAHGLSEDRMRGLWGKVEDARKKLHGTVRELEDAVSAEMRA